MQRASSMVCISFLFFATYVDSSGLDDDLLKWTQNASKKGVLSGCGKAAGGISALQRAVINAIQSVEQKQKKWISGLEIKGPTSYNVDVHSAYSIDANVDIIDEAIFSTVTCVTITSEKWKI
ncbi:hypothetical protein H5185_04835 [Shewanella sp. SG44-6]|uniref:hypothetical protein n=1 Tax=Shewanella sp. SG44-6 TaxID=2760959 RepID=UPI0016036CC8|nr:hypothetical protein [Shewanella sp. SG44-6]MBB1388749.1 hypothetical protein [Shewanella sp. SG44-6]